MTVNVLPTARRELDRLARNLEEIWGFIDGLIDSVPQERWSRRYGKDWTYADVPWHLAYFDRIVIAEPLAAGTDLAADARFNLGSMRELNAWNDAEFARRPARFGPRESIAELRSVHERIRQQLSGADDSLLEQPCFNHFFGAGFTGTVRAALRSAALHSWGEGTELMVRLGRRDPVPESATRNALEGYMGFMANSVDVRAAGDAPFTLVMNLTGLGGGAYTIHVAHGEARLIEGDATDADVRMTLDPVTFNCVMIRRMSNPMLAMLKRKVRVKGLTRMGRMQKIFREPKLDDQLTGSLFT
jgi:hypothetical protein